MKIAPAAAHIYWPDACDPYLNNSYITS